MGASYGESGGITNFWNTKFIIFTMIERKNSRRGRKPFRRSPAQLTLTPFFNISREACLGSGAAQKGAPAGTIGLLITAQSAKRSIGVWRSWLARLVWDQEAGGSSPLTPTITHERSECVFYCRFYSGRLTPLCYCRLHGRRHKYVLLFICCVV